MVTVPRWIARILIGGARFSELEKRADRCGEASHDWSIPLFPAVLDVGVTCISVDATPQGSNKNIESDQKKPEA